MPELDQLIQLIAIADCGTMSAAAKKLHLSQPALSRSMQRLEESLQVILFDRKKNKVTLNATGELVVTHARRVVEQINTMTEQARDFDRRQHAIAVGSCAPAPLWKLLSFLSSLYPETSVVSEMKDEAILLSGLADNTYQLVVLSRPITSDSLLCLPFEKEQLYFSLPKTHPLAAANHLSFKDIDGENVLLLAEIGFWRDVCEQMMPNTRLIVQQEQNDFDTLVDSSVLPCFASSLTLHMQGWPQNRVSIPITDAEAYATYYLLCSKNNTKKLSALIHRINTDS